MIGRVARCAPALVILAGFAARAEDGGSPVGFWSTGPAPDNGVIEIFACDSGYCGKLVHLQPRPPGTPTVDLKNPNAARRGDPLCGLVMMGSFKADGTGKFVGGWAYDPDSGNTYSGQMKLDGPDTLKLRGYVGIPLFGRTETWTRETGDFSRC